jgi:hypothetical protein
VQNPEPPPGSPRWRRRKSKREKVEYAESLKAPEQIVSRPSFEPVTLVTDLQFALQISS